MAGPDPAIQLTEAAMMPAGFVYILASKPYGTLYIGVTADWTGRIEAHRLGEGSTFVKKYQISHLVYFEEYPLYADAIRRETNLKKWKRDWKIALVDKANPEWKDLIETWHH